MKGHGVSGGALSIINAIATGRGAAFGIDLSTSAEVELLDEPEFNLTINGKVADASFAKSLLLELAKNCPEIEFFGANVKTTSNIPVAKGLKSSSAAANAIIQAAADATGLHLLPNEILKINAKASITAGVSITGAFDDAAACLLGGLVFTDNKKMTVLERRAMPEEYAVVIHVPENSLATADFNKNRFMEMKSDVEAAYNMAKSGDIFSAMCMNGCLVARANESNENVANIARTLNARAAGFSGTGPATGILVEKENLQTFMGEFTEALKLDTTCNDYCIITDIRNEALP